MHRLVRTIIIALIVVTIAVMALNTPTANARRATPPPHGTKARRAWAIHKVFGAYGSQAVRVATCESGIRPWARNGQYQGAFQMGRSERSRYGHGRDIWKQARAAWRYFNATGKDWSPWTCRP